MKKAVCILLAALTLVLAATATVNAEIINKSAMKFVREAVEEAQKASAAPIKTNRLYLKMPASWYSDYGVYQGKYYASVYWWEAAAAPETFPGYRMMIDDYAQGVYYADIPEDVSTVVWGNGFGTLQSEFGTQKDRELAYTDDVNLEGALEGEYDSLPEETVDPFSFDGYIYVVDGGDPQVTSIFSGRTYYPGSWYAYYGGGCYGSYAEGSDHFTSVSDNCLNPDHFDAQGNHIGGAHLTAPEAPDDPPTNPDLNGYYIVSDLAPDVIRSENKLYPSSKDGEYYKSVSISRDFRFRIVYFEDGKQLDECAWFPEWGWYNANAELDDDLSGHYYTLYFYPDETGGSSIVLSDPRNYPTESPIETPTEAPTELPTESDPAVPPYLYKDRFVEKYIDADEQGTWGYRELYYHKDENGETDWALVQGYQPMVSPLEYVTVIANRVLSPYNIYYPFSARYGIYDVKADAFIDAGGREAKSYPDFVHVFDETVTEGRLLGDLDRDNTISVIDATIIQRCEANLRDFPEDDIFYVTYEWGNPRYYSDFDRDGERDITDTTAIQRYLVGIS